MRLLFVLLLLFTTGFLDPARVWAQSDSDAWNGVFPVVSVQEIGRYIYPRLQTPVVCAVNGISGIVICWFRVSGSGITDSFSAKQSVHPIMDAEAMRVLREAPLWRDKAAKMNAPAWAAQHHQFIEVPVQFIDRSGDRSFSNIGANAMGHPAVAAFIYGVPAAVAVEASKRLDNLTPVDSKPDRLAWLARNDDTFAAPKYVVQHHPSRKNPALFVEVTVGENGIVSRVEPVFWPKHAIQDSKPFEALTASLERDPPRPWQPALRKGKPVRSRFLLPLSYR